MRRNVRSDSLSSRRRVHRALCYAALASATAVVLAACGGATGSNGASDSSSSDAATSSSAEGSGEADSGTDATKKPRVFAAFSSLLEEPWDGAVHRALQAAADAGEIEYSVTDDIPTFDKMSRTLNDILSNQNPDIIFGDSFPYEDDVRALAAEHSDVQFVFGSGEVRPVDPNFSVFDNWLQDPAYLAGMLAGGVTKSGTIGVVAAMPIPEVNRIVNAFIKGVGETNGSATVKVTFINSFFDPTAAKQAALAQVAQGADVLFAERDGVIEAAKEKNLPVIGMMIDQKDEAPKNVMTSLVWDMRPTVEEAIKEFQNGNLHASDMGPFSFMKNGGSSLAPINTDVPGGIAQDLVDQVTAKQKDIMDGTFETPVDESAPAGSTTAGQ